MKTHIVTISDTHGRHKEIEVPEGDILIHAGDFSNVGYKHEIEDFLDWFGSKPHQWKILIAGNHDKGTDPDRKESCYQDVPEYFKKLCAINDIILLNDDYCTVWDNEGNILKIWGSPVSPTFGYNWAWNRNRGDTIKAHWDKIPKDTDIVITHGPAYGYGDRVMYSKFSGGDRVGCEELLKKIEEIEPILHVVGHIHEDRGVFAHHTKNITFCNSSSLTLRYTPYLSRTFRFDLDKLKIGKSIGDDYE